jgi:hypothetical protein
VTGFQFEVEVNLGPTDSRPVCLGVSTHLGPAINFLFLLEISFRHLRVCYFVALFLMRGRVWNLLYNCFWALPEHTLGWKSRGTRDHILLSQFLRLPKPGDPGPRIYIPQGQGGPDIPPALSSLSVVSYVSQGYGGGILTRLHTGLTGFNPKCWTWSAQRLTWSDYGHWRRVATVLSHSRCFVPRMRTQDAFVGAREREREREERKRSTEARVVATSYRGALLFFKIPFYLQSVLVHSANCVKKQIHVYSGM